MKRILISFIGNIDCLLADGKEGAIMTFINGKWDGIRKTQIPKSGLPAYNMVNNIRYTTIIKDACSSIYDITSDCVFMNIQKKSTVRV